MRSWLKLLVAGAALGAMVPAAHAATIPVTTTTDVLKIDGLCSLREAILAAGADQSVDGIQAGLPGCTAGTAGEDTIQLGPGTYPIAPQTSGTPEDLNFVGDYDIVSGNKVRLIGAGMGATTIAGSNDRLFDVGFGGSSLVLTDLTVRDSVAPGGESGGAVRNRGTLTVLRVAFVNTAAGNSVPGTDKPIPAGAGGAISSSGTLDVAGSSFSATRAGDGLPGQTIQTPTSITTFGATAGGSGGAIAVTGGTASLSGITVTGARAGDGQKRLDAAGGPGGSGGAGGALAVTGGAATIVNSTFQGNRAGNAGSPVTYFSSRALPGDGGAIAAANGATAVVTFSTFSGNAPGTGSDGAPGAGASIAGASAGAGASILADAGGACATPLSGGLVNITLPGDASCPGVKIAGDPRLGGLAGNGGPVQTMALAAGSPAIDAVVGVPCPATDARGLPRPRLAGCDAGAVEVQAGEPAAAAPVAAKTLAPGTTTTRRISGVTLSRSAFTTYGRKKGTTLGVRLSVASRIVLGVTKPTQGRRSKGTCVRPTKKLAGKARCTRQVPLRGSLSKAGKAGLNTIAFSGKLRGKALAPGAYTFVITLPKSGAAKAVVATKGFRILP